MKNYISTFVLLLFVITIDCNPHVHQRSNERVEDGAQSIHYKDGEHHSEFDHEAVLGSRDKAREFDTLSPLESKKRLRVLASEGMDFNHNGFVDKDELTEWVLKSFKSLAEEDGREQLIEEDTNNDGVVSWDEHLRDTFDIEDSSEAENALRDELMSEDRALWNAADRDGDGKLNAIEFAAFNSPEEYDYMHDALYQQTMKKKDKNRDGVLDLAEFSSDVNGIPSDVKSEHFIVEKDRFHNDYDIDKNGKLSKDEVLLWIIPDNREMAENEANHLITSSDDDHDGLLSINEIVDHHDIFVGSEATDFGQQLEGLRLTDEL